MWQNLKYGKWDSTLGASRDQAKAYGISIYSYNNSVPASFWGNLHG